MSTFRVLQFNMQFGQGWDEADPDHARLFLSAAAFLHGWWAQAGEEP